LIVNNDEVFGEDETAQRKTRTCQWFLQFGKHTQIGIMSDAFFEDIKEYISGPGSMAVKTMNAAVVQMNVYEMIFSRRRK